jgi:hypothetical protein
MHLPFEIEPFSRSNEAEEYALLRAILGRAILDALSNSDRIRREALQWLKSETLEPFSYIWICDMLEISRSFAHDEILRRRADTDL